MGIETPIVVGRATLTPPTVPNEPGAAPSGPVTGSGSPDRAEQAHLVVDAADGGLGDRAGALGAVLEDAVELGRVVHELERAGPERGDRLDDDLGDVLLEVAVALAGVLLLEDRDRGARERRVDREEVGHARLVVLVVADLAHGVGDGRADLLGDPRRLVE